MIEIDAKTKGGYICILKKVKKRNHQLPQMYQTLFTGLGEKVQTAINECKWMDMRE